MTIDPNIDLKVVRIKDRWYGTLLVDGSIHDRMACQLKGDIGWMCREMLRWYCKLGGISKYAEAARKRQNKSKPPSGRIWYMGELTPL